jgi:hypothetical protein
MRTPDVHEVPSISCKHEQIQFFHTLKDTQKKKNPSKNHAQIHTCTQTYTYPIPSEYLLRYIIFKLQKIKDKKN